MRSLKTCQTTKATLSTCGLTGNLPVVALPRTHLYVRTDAASLASFLCVAMCSTSRMVRVLIPGKDRDRGRHRGRNRGRGREKGSTLAGLIKLLDHQGGACASSKQQQAAASSKQQATQGPFWAPEQQGVPKSEKMLPRCPGWFSATFSGTKNFPGRIPTWSETGI